jgi:hypothetical protein
METGARVQDVLSIPSNRSQPPQPKLRNGWRTYIHKLIKVVQGTQVRAPPAYCENHHEELRHNEPVAQSRISIVGNDRLGTWPSRQ